MWPRNQRQRQARLLGVGGSETKVHRACWPRHSQQVRGTEMCLLWEMAAIKLKFKLAERTFPREECSQNQAPRAERHDG